MLTHPARHCTTKGSPPATPAAVAARLAEPRSTRDPALAAYRISIGRLDAQRPPC